MVDAGAKLTATPQRNMVDTRVWPENGGFGILIQWFPNPIRSTLPIQDYLRSELVPKGVQSSPGHRQPGARISTWDRAAIPASATRKSGAE